MASSNPGRTAGGGLRAAARRTSPVPSAPSPEDGLQERIGYRFRDSERLRLALTHRSWRGEESGVAAEAGETAADNERLEFLGDAVLGLRVSERLVEAYPQSSEGQLSRLRAWLVSARHLGVAAERLELGRCLRISRAEESIGGRNKPRLLANAAEALIAALYLDGGYAAAAGFIDRHILGASLDELTPGHLHEFAYKSALQEWAHAEGRAVPAYRILGERGPQHAKTFTVEVTLPGVYTGTGSGSSKKTAEQKAAGAALAFLGLLPAEDEAAEEPAG